MTDQLAQHAIRSLSKLLSDDHPYKYKTMRLTVKEFGARRRYDESIGIVRYDLSGLGRILGSELRVERADFSCTDIELRVMEEKLCRWGIRRGKEWKIQ